MNEAHPIGYKFPSEVLALANEVLEETSKVCQESCTSERDDAVALGQLKLMGVIAVQLTRIAYSVARQWG